MSVLKEINACRISEKIFFFDDIGRKRVGERQRGRERGRERESKRDGERRSGRERGRAHRINILNV